MNRLAPPAAAISRGSAVGFGILGVIVVGTTVPSTSWIGVAGLLVLSVGVTIGRRVATTIGAGGIVGGGLVAGVGGAPTGATLVAVACGIIAWDLGRYGLGLADQLGRGADTRRSEVTHAVAGIGVGMASVGAGSIVFERASGGQPLSALVALVLAAVVAVAILLFTGSDGEP